MSAPTAPALVGGIGHIALNTPDLDRFRRFYDGVLGLEVVVVARMDHPPHLRHAVLRVDDLLVLHAFEVPGYDPAADGLTGVVGHRGRIDHFGFAVADEGALRRVADRLVAAGASDGTVQALGPILSVPAQDPDGLAFAVTCPRPGLTAADLDADDTIEERGDPAWVAALVAASARLAG